MLQYSSYRRFVVVIVLFGLSFAGLQYRLFDLQIRRHEELLAKADRFLQVRRVVEPWRGRILSREGEALAMDVPDKEVWADLNVCGQRPRQMADVLSPHFGTNPRRLAVRLQPTLIGFGTDDRPLYRQAALLRRHLAPEEWEQVRGALIQASFGLDTESAAGWERRLLQSLRTRAVIARDGHRRYYPFGSMLSPVLGFATESPGQPVAVGQAGLERSLQRVLMGVPGSLQSDRAASGTELPWRRRELRDPVDGNHVVLTIHAALQRVVEEALAGIMSEHDPASASILVVHPPTGAILAFGLAPGFDPQRPGASPADTWRNRAVSDQVEPGSTFKLVTLAAVLNEGLADLEDQVFCEDGSFVYRAPQPGTSQFRRITLKDYKQFGWLTVAEVLSKSSNIGAAKLALRLGPARLHEYITRFGFGTSTGIALPGEAAGWIRPPADWLSGPILYIPMGQGIAVTQLQMVMAYAAIANDGLLMRPMLIDRIESPAGQVLVQCQPQPVRQVVRPEIARSLAGALRKVVSHEGTGWAAASHRVTIAGKTGTAQVSDRDGYLPGCYYASFIGFLPAESPELCIAVAVDRPRHGHQGGVVAAPAFKAVAEAALALLGIGDDKA